MIGVAQRRGSGFHPCRASWFIESLKQDGGPDGLPSSGPIEIVLFLWNLFLLAYPEVLPPITPTTSEYLIPESLSWTRPRTGRPRLLTPVAQAANGGEP